MGNNLAAYKDTLTHFLWQEVDIIFVSASRGIVEFYQGKGLDSKKNKRESMISEVSTKGNSKYFFVL